MNTLCSVTHTGLELRSNCATCTGRPTQGQLMLRRSQQLYLEGEAALYVYAVVSGYVREARMTPDGRTQGVRLVGPGEVTGLEALRAPYYRSSAETLSRARVCRIPRRDVEMQLRNHADQAMAMVGALVDDDMSSKKNKIPPKKVVTSPVRTRSVRKTLVDLPGKIETGGLQVGAALLLVAIAFILYFPSMRFGYVLDDQIVITDNAYTKQGFSGIGKLLTEESFQGYFGTTKKLVEGGRYRPLSLVTFAMEWEFFHQEKKDAQGKPVLDKKGLAIVEGNPQLSHFINILLYALSVVLMYFLLMYLFPSGGGKAAFWSVPFIASLLFVLHPLHGEPVSNIKRREAARSPPLLSMCFQPNLCRRIRRCWVTQGSLQHRIWVHRQPRRKRALPLPSPSRCVTI